MELIFLGTGTSQGVPMIAHDPVGLDLTDKRNWRTRTSAHVVMDGVHFQIDAAPEFRLQCVNNQIRRVDYFILTHGHADHVQGMDDLRRFIDLRGGDALPVFGTDEGLLRVRQIYPYAIRQRPEFKGYPAFNLLPMPEVLELPCGTVWSTLLPHGRLQVLGLVFQERSTGRRLAYYTDCKEVTPHAMQLAHDLDVLVLDALRPDEHPTHLSVPEAKAAAARIGAQRTFFTHMTYMIDHERDSKDLAGNTAFAYDGLKVTV